MTTAVQTLRNTTAKAERLQRWLALPTGSRCSVWSSASSAWSAEETDSSRVSEEDEARATWSSHDANDTRTARIARWQLQGPTSRYGYYRKPATLADASSAPWVQRVASTGDSWQSAHTQQPLRVTTSVLADGVCETRLSLARAGLRATQVDDGQATVTTVTKTASSGGASEVVFRRMTILEEGEGSRSRSITESGSASATVDLLECAALRYGTSCPALLRVLSSVPNAESVLAGSLPAGYHPTLGIT